MAPLVQEAALASHACPDLCVLSACLDVSVWPVSFVSPPPLQAQTPSQQTRQAKPRTDTRSTANRTRRQDTTAHDTRQSSVSWSIPLVTLSVSASAHVVSIDKTRQDKIKRQGRSRPEQTRPQNLSRLVGLNLDLLIPPLTLTSLHKQSPVSCYFLPASNLSHSLFFGVSPLIRPHGHAIFTNLSCSFFDSPTSTLPFLTGRKAAEADLWYLSVPPAPAAFSLAVAAPLHPPSAFFSLQSLTAARFVAYWYCAFSSPSLSTFLRALKLGFIRGMPLLTPKLVSKYPPLSLSTSFGHFDTLRKGIASTYKKISPSCLGPVVSMSVLPRTSPRLEAIQSSFPVNSSRATTHMEN
jgi:hypothetical protein